MFCPKCGTPNKESDSFCANCGGALNVVVVQYEPVPVPVAPPVTPPAEPAPVKKHAHPMVIIMSIFAMIAGINSLLFIWSLRFGLALSLAGLILGIAGAITGSIEKQKHGMASAGIACSAVTLGIYLTLLVLGLLIGEGIVDFWWMY